MEYFMEKRDWTRLLKNAKFEQVKKIKKHLTAVNDMKRKEVQGAGRHNVLRRK